MEKSNEIVKIRNERIKAIDSKNEILKAQIDVKKPKITFTPFDPLVKKTAFLIMGSGVVITIGRFCIETFLCDKFIQKTWIRYRYGLPMQKLNTNLSPLTTQVLTDLKLEHVKDKFEFFPCMGNETMYAGLYHLRKAHIGLPFYFDYTDEKQIDKNAIACFGEAPNFKQEKGKLFLQNLVLSEKAKKYAIAEMVTFSKSAEQIMSCLTFFGASLFSTTTFLRLDILLKNKKKNLQFGKRYAISLGLGIAMYFLWLYILKRFADEYSKETIDLFLQDLKKLKDQEYIEGGIEYYSKMQKRYQILRSFMGDDGKKLIKSNGNPVSFLSGRYTITEMIENLSKCYDFSKRPVEAK